MSLNYDELRRIYRLEKNTSKPVELPSDFYNLLNDFVAKEKASFLDSLKELNSAKAKDFNNLKKMLEEFFTIRQKKILNQALIALHTSDFSEEDKLALPEKEIFKNVINLLKNHRELFKSIFSNNSGKKEKKNNLNFVAVKILKETPGFVGTDLKEYGPFKKEQTANLPYKIAKLLLSKSIAELEEID